MKQLHFLLILLFVTSAALYAQTVIPPDSAKNYVDKQVTVTGVVDQVHLTDTGTYFLNMDGKFPDNTFTAVIFSKDSSAFTNIKSFEGKDVAVTGTITDYKGSPEIILKSYNQIKIMKVRPE